MSDHKHTPEPWIIGKINHKKQRVDIDSRSPENRLGYDYWEGLARTYGCEDESDVGSEVMVANARRIVACVNACAGISTDALERSKSLEDFMRSMKVIEQQRDELNRLCEFNQRTMDELLRQRDVLLSACESVIAWDKAREFPIPYRVRDPIHAAIASVKRGAA